MDKSKAIELLKQALGEIPHLRELHYERDKQEFELWRDKVQNIIKAALGPDDLKRFSSRRPVHVRGWFPDDVYQQDYLDKLTDYETALKSIIQKYEILGVETESAAKTEPPKSPEDYEKKAGKELELILEGTPDMIIESIMNFVKKLNSQGYAYKSIPRIGDAPDYSRRDKTHSAYCTIVEAREGVEKQIGIMRLQLLPKEKTLLVVPEPKDWKSSFGVFLSYLVGEFKRLGFVHFEEEKPPIGFRLPHKENNA
jgi:hypothetical protein